MQRTTTKTMLVLALTAFLASGLMACGDDEFVENQNQENEQHGEEEEITENQAEEESIEVAGTWENQFGMTETIDDEMWDFMHLVDFDNGERWAITQNPDDDEHNPDAYNRLYWTSIEDDTFYYCTAVFGKETEDEAREAEGTADEEDLEGGCGEGGFEWTEMIRQ